MLILSKAIIDDYDTFMFHFNNVCKFNYIEYYVVLMKTVTTLTPVYECPLIIAKKLMNN